MLRKANGTADVTLLKELESIEPVIGHLESKERLRIQPAQLFNFS